MAHPVLKDGTYVHPKIKKLYIEEETLWKLNLTAINAAKTFITSFYISVRFR